LLVIGAYRTGGGDEGAAARLLETLSSGAVATNRIELGGLNEGDVASLLEGALQVPLDDCRPLASLIHQKTDGNPFFVSQFLIFAHRERLIAFDRSAQCWRWDLHAIAAQGITDDVLQLMSRKLLRLTPAAHDCLQIAACFGSVFDVQKIALVIEKPEHEILAELDRCEGHGLIVRVDRGVEPSIAPGVGVVAFRFLHDRVQQAAYGLISAEARPAVHLRIGSALLPQL